jgi:hypothetical protein
MAAAARHRLPQDPPHLAQDPRPVLAVLGREAGRALDVGEEESDDSVGQFTHAASVGTATA